METRGAEKKVLKELQTISEMTEAFEKIAKRKPYYIARRSQKCNKTILILKTLCSDVCARQFYAPISQEA
jgi:hypothetical protein